MRRAVLLARSAIVGGVVTVIAHGPADALAQAANASQDSTANLVPWIALVVSVIVLVERIYGRVSDNTSKEIGRLEGRIDAMAADAGANRELLVRLDERLQHVQGTLAARPGDRHDPPA